MFANGCSCSSRCFSRRKGRRRVINTNHTNTRNARYFESSFQNNNQFKETTQEEEAESQVTQEEPVQATTTPTKESETEIKAVSQPQKTSKQVSSTSATTTTTTPVTVTTLTPQMFGEPSVNEQKLQKQNEVATLVAEANNCPNSCSYIGLCRNNVCYCTNGYTGEDCSEANIDNLGKGESIEKTMEYAGAFFILGAIIGTLLCSLTIFSQNSRCFYCFYSRK